MRANLFNILILLTLGIFIPSITIADQEKNTTNSNLTKPLIEKKVEKTGLVPESYGQKAKAFFDPETTNSVFDEKSVSLTEQPKVQMLNAGFAKEEELLLEKQNTQQKVKKIEKKSITEEWGDPNEDEPIKGEKSAPRPFRGMLAALQEGNEELAYQYARKYIRYVRDVEDRTRKAQELFGYARQREGIDPIDANNELPDYNGFRKHFEDDLRKTANETRALKLDDKTRGLLERARQEELGVVQTQTTKSSGPALGIDDKGYVRSKLTKKIPVDPKGQLEIYFFFHYNDSKGIEMVKSLNEIARKYSNDRSVRITGLALKPLMDAELAMYANTVQAGFGIRNGNEIAKQLNIIKSPTLAFIAPNTGEVMIEEGGRSFNFIDEIIKVSKGIQ